MTMEEIHERLAQRGEGFTPHGFSGPREHAAGMIANWARFKARDPGRDVRLIEKYGFTHYEISLLNQTVEAHGRGEAYSAEPEQSQFIEADELTEEMRAVDDPYVEHCPRCGHVRGVREVAYEHFGYCLEHRLKWKVLMQSLDLDERSNPFLTLLHWQADEEFLASFETVVGEPTEEMRKAAKERKEKDYAKVMEYVRGRPIDYASGTVGRIQTTFAKILVETTPELIKPENGDKLMDAIKGVYDRKQAVERAASLGVVLTSEQITAMNAACTSSLPF